MNDKEILEKALFQAHQNGMRPQEVEKEFFINWKPLYDTEPVEYFPWLSEGAVSNLVAVSKVIFSHEFAKAFWKEEDWKVHLQQMVLEKDPVSYVGKFIINI